MARCEQCPVAADCRGRRLGLQRELPIRRAKPAPVAVGARVLLAHGRGGVFGHRLPGGAINGGQIELPGPGVLRDCAPEELVGELAARFGCRAEIGPVLGSVRHAITNHRVVVHAHAGRVGARGRLATFAPGDPSVPWSTVSRKVFAAVLGAGPAEQA
jgi:adenine-specific DNA glycosylase